jgi:hypothetical protein
MKKKAKKKSVTTPAAHRRDQTMTLDELRAIVERDPRAVLKVRAAWVLYIMDRLDTLAKARGCMVETVGDGATS